MPSLARWLHILLICRGSPLAAGTFIELLADPTEAAVTAAICEGVLGSTRPESYTAGTETAR